MFLFILQEEKLKCEVYLSEMSWSAWQNEEFRDLLPVDVGVQNQVLESISVMPCSLCSQSWYRQEKALFSQNAFTASLHIQTYHTYFLPFQYSFFFSPDNLTYILWQVFLEQGMMFHSCNISLILKDQVSTLPADLYPVMLSLSIYNHGVGKASCMQRSD